MSTRLERIYTIREVWTTKWKRTIVRSVKIGTNSTSFAGVVLTARVATVTEIFSLIMVMTIPSSLMPVPPVMVPVPVDSEMSAPDIVDHARST